MSPSRPRTALVLCVALLGASHALSCTPKAGASAPAPSPQSAVPTTDTPQASDDSSSLTSLWTSADSLQSRCDAALAEASAVRTALRDQPAGTPQQTLGAFDAISTAFDNIAGMEAMASLHPEKSVRDAADLCSQRVAKWRTETNLDPQLYARATELEGAPLAPLDVRYTQRLLRNFRLAGVDKDEPTRKRLAELDERMVKISQDFERNVREDVRTIQIADESGLAGLPADYIAAHPKNDQGQIVISTDYPDFFPFETYAENAELRKALYLAFINRAYPKNEALLLEQLTVRREYATLLGFDNWADYATSDKMVGSSQGVADFIAQLQQLVQEPMAKDVRELMASKLADDPQAQRYELWDRFYYRTKVQQEKFQVDPQQVRAYFSYPKVRDGILALYGKLFGVEFSRLDTPTWHPSVTAWSMQKQSKEIGRFYFDMHPRDGKFKHAAMSQLRTGNSGERIPIGVLMCNFPDPSQGDGHALMEHKDVLTFFHEFGHLIHHQLATDSPWIEDNGIATEWDFVEAPSQLLEEWAWDPQVLATFATHYQTGEAIPAPLVDKLRRADEFGKAASLGRQLFYAALSHELHRRDPAELQLEELMGEMYAQYSPFAQPEGGHTYASFGHLMGYSSNYYTYQWSLGIAKDLFTRFEAEGLLNPQVAADYRRSVLAPGGSQDAKHLVHQFLGRDYNLDAYRAWLRGE